MHHLSLIPSHSIAALPLPLATVEQVLGSNAALIGGIAVILVLAIPIIAIVGAYYTKHRREQLWNETARLAIEKGQPVPVRPPSDDELRAPPLPTAGVDLREWDRLKRIRKRREDIRNGLLLAAFGGALALAHPGHGTGFPGYILLFIGIALFLNGILDGVFFGGSDDASGHPPQS